MKLEVLEQPKKNMLKRVLVYGSIVALLLVIIAYFGLRVWFRAEINELSEKPGQQFVGDKVEVLVAALGSSDYTLEEKNDIIWALGKLKDKRALSMLRLLYTGEECNHSSQVCQETLEIAITTIEGERVDLFTFKE